MSKKTRPTKKQFETLQFIKDFIVEHGYSPSYREIMKGCNYTSVATVSLHVTNLIKRGHLAKRDNSARSLEVVAGKDQDTEKTHKHELVDHIEQRFSQLEKDFSDEVLNEVFVLVGALKVMGHVDIARAYATRLNQLQ
jgi:SOS-response transcriptional repressor LexA